MNKIFVDFGADLLKVITGAFVGSVFTLLIANKKHHLDIKINALKVIPEKINNLIEKATDIHDALVTYTYNVESYNKNVSDTHCFFNDYNNGKINFEDISKYELDELKKYISDNEILNSMDKKELFILNKLTKSLDFLVYNKDKDVTYNNLWNDFEYCFRILIYAFESEPEMLRNFSDVTKIIKETYDRLLEYNRSLSLYMLQIRVAMQKSKLLEDILLSSLNGIELLIIEEIQLLSKYLTNCKSNLENNFKKRTGILKYFY